MRIQSSLVRSGVLCSLALGAYLVGMRPAAADLTLAEVDGWTFFTNGRVNSFLSYGFGDDFPPPTLNPLNPNLVDGNGVPIPQPQHNLVGLGQPFTAGYSSFQGNASGKYSAMRVRSGFIGSILAFGIKRQVTETTTAKGYVSLWGTAETFSRDRVQDSGLSTAKGFDVREGYVAFEGPWGALAAGRQGGLLGSITTEIDFLYGHNYGLGLPCLDVYYPSCGHVGTGALGEGTAAGFVYQTRSLGGLRLKAGIYDPVRLLGAWERVPYPRPEGTLSFERRMSPGFMFKVQAEGMYQYMGILASTRSDTVWGVAGGARIEAGPLRLGVSAFRGKGLGAYVALQNSGSTFSGPPDYFLRYFTGLYAQSALVFGPLQISVGLGRTMDDQLETDKVDPNNSALKSQTGLSSAIYFNVTENLALGIDYFRFQTDWWGARNSSVDVTGVVTILPGVLTPEKQIINFINAGATFHW